MVGRSQSMMNMMLKALPSRSLNSLRSSKSNSVMTNSVINNYQTISNLIYPSRAEDCICSGYQIALALIICYGGFDVWRSLRQVSRKTRHATECLGVWFLMTKIIRDELQMASSGALPVLESTASCSKQVRRESLEALSWLPLEALLRNPIAYLRAFDFAWEQSPNVRGLTYTRLAAFGTFPVKARRAPAAGRHCWRVCWAPPFGSHATIGVVGNRCQVRVSSEYCSWVGRQPHSWGLDLVNGTIMHEGKQARTLEFDLVNGKTPLFDPMDMRLFVNADTGHTLLVLKMNDGRLESSKNTRTHLTAGGRTLPSMVRATDMSL
ncbi:hypothetical protein GNI_106060 [Gregarina niphandrodes]|uniref:Uncharacterized protein n=1 Tax=Gregarina niphandrodes TaxID=110365 RepID=A0A023B3W9_GRENI|nr:hypothetical protein GNI_106060 [Gregarina niphandrodes]EZG56042.1 hypothetical protein GNI_106060 [Gregarina niphandrodes]|eukprot:XP_011131361.1 hypothetical protein GNI_106060 [Gregarina niphandrodes]